MLYYIYLHNNDKEKIKKRKRCSMLAMYIMNEALAYFSVDVASGRVRFFLNYFEFYFEKFECLHRLLLISHYCYRYEVEAAKVSNE